MTNSTRFIVNPFGVSGSLTSIPDIPNPSFPNEVNYLDGWGPLYEADQAVNPSALDIDRAKHNSLFNDVTTFIKYMQDKGGIPEWVTPAQNTPPPALPTAKSYPKNAMIRYEEGDVGTPDGEVYISTVDANTEEPTQGSNWILGTTIESTGSAVNIPDMFVTYERLGSQFGLACPLLSSTVARILINTIEINNIPGASLSSNIVTLPIGSYLIDCDVDLFPFNVGGDFALSQLSLFDESAVSQILPCSRVEISQGSANDEGSTLKYNCYGVFSLVSSTNIGFRFISDELMPSIVEPFMGSNGIVNIAISQSWQALRLKIWKTS